MEAKSLILAFLAFSSCEQGLTMLQESFLCITFVFSYVFVYVFPTYFPMYLSHISCAFAGVFVYVFTLYLHMYLYVNSYIAPQHLVGGNKD